VDDIDACRGVAMPKWLIQPQSLMLFSALVLGSLGTTVDWRLLSRPLTYPKNPITAANWYQPQGPVAGAQVVNVLNPSATTAIPQSALKKALDFAKAQNSVALLIMHRDELVLEQYWQGHPSDGLVNSMSMVKTLLALLVGVAIEEGHIQSVQDPVSLYIPEWAHDPRGDITLADLLYMQSGLENDDRVDTIRSDLVQLYMGSDAHQTALNVPLQDNPGEIYDYNNFNSQILGMVLERATGKTFSDYLSTHLWQPLQNHNGFVWMDRPGGHAKPFCCFFATAQDWARVGQMLLHQGKVGNTQVVPADWIQQMLKTSPLEPTFGMHIWIKARTDDYTQVNRASSAPFAAADTFYLDGRHHQRVYVIPSHDLVIVRIGEEPSAWDDSVIPNALVEGLRNQS
jgi:CubicO group peptidase (beta-lactamase class C family)